MPDPDRSALERLRARQRHRLAAYLAGEVHPFSPPEAGRLDGAGIGRHGLRDLADLDALAPVRLHDLDGLDRVLRPTADGLGRSSLRWRWHLARATGGRTRFVDERIEPTYRAIHFDDHDGFVVASSAADLDRLARIGRRALEAVGVRADDALVSVLPARGDLAFWQVTSGCRRGGVPSLHLGDDAEVEEVESYAPSVVVGDLLALRRIGARSGPDGVRLVVVAGTAPLTDADRLDLGARFPGAAIRALWAPPGVRALWAECEGGEVHTWPDAEVVEAVDGRGDLVAAGAPGELVWTPIGWRGTVVLRVLTGAVGAIVDGTCPGCGRTSPRIETTPGRPAASSSTDRRRAAAAPAFEDVDLELALASVLDEEALVAAWSAEHMATATGHDTLVVHLAPVAGGRAALEADLARLGAELGVDRLVVERPSLVAERVAHAQGRRVSSGGAR